MMGFLRRARSFVWEKRTFLVLEGGAAQGQPPAMPVGMEIRWVDQAEDPVGIKLMAATDLGAKFMKRWRSGEGCVVALSGDLPAHFSWLSRTEMVLPEIDFSRRLLPDTGYLYHSYTFPPFRGKGIYASVLIFARVYAQTHGLQRLLIATESQNVVAQRAMARAGFVPISSLRARRVFGFRTLSDCH